MRDMVIVGGKLALICVIAALSLGIVNAVTEPAIARERERALADALRSVSFGGTVGPEVPVDENEAITSYYLLSGDGKNGYIVRLVAVGYGGEMQILASYDDTGTVVAASLLDNQETPGLGKEAERPEYMEKYLGTGGSKPVPVSKNSLSQEDADAITGATITFVGIGDALASGADFVKHLGGTK
jgi:Na+-translocating ferredoxin:NAD+ oxidoreductase subunit G